MKLNPFSKKANGYLSIIKAQHDQLQQEIEDLEDALVDARADYEAAQEKNKRLREKAGSLSMNTPPAAKAHWPVVCETSQKVKHMEFKLNSLQSRIPPLNRLLAAPERHEKAQAHLQELNSRQGQLESDIAKADVSIAKLEKRVTEVQARIATENQIAAKALIGAEGEFTVPEVLAKLEAELRLAQTALNDLSANKAAWLKEKDDVRSALRDAEREIVYSRATIAEIDLFDKVMPIMDLFALATVSRKEASPSTYEYKYEIEIPSEFIRAARKALGVRTDD